MKRELKFKRRLGLALVAMLCIDQSCKRSEPVLNLKEISNNMTMKLNGTATSLFSQDFESSATVPTYVSSTPGTDKFNAIGVTTTGSTVSINSGKLKFTRNTGGVGYYSRTSGFATVPSVMQYSFDLSVSGNSTYGTIATFQVGDGFSNGNNASTGTPVESDALVHSKMAIYTNATDGSFCVRDISPNVRSDYFSGTQKITWVINNSSVIVRYIDPLGKTETLGADAWDLWIGNVKVFDERTATTATQPLNNLKFALTGGTGVSMNIDNINVEDLSDLANTPINGDLIFHSGFEGTTSLYSFTAQTTKITGIDQQVTAPNNWVTDFAPWVGRFDFSFEGGDTTMRKVSIVPDPTNSSNKVLEYWLADANALNFTKGRIQANAADGNGMKEVYQKVRMYLSTDFNTIKTWDQESDWLTIFEFWNNKTWDNAPDPFRVKVTIAKPSASPNTSLNFRVTAQTYNPTNDAFSTKWTSTNTSYQVPIAQWVTMEYYFKEGNTLTGRFYLAITPDGGSKQVLFDINNCTHDPTINNPDGLTDFNPMKIYTSKELMDYMKSQGKILRIYWDDFELWRDKRP